MCSFLNRLLKPRPVRLSKHLGTHESPVAMPRSGTHRDGLYSVPCKLPPTSVLEDFKMSLETLLIIVLLVFLLGGGGWYWGRGRG